MVFLPSCHWGFRPSCYIDGSVSYGRQELLRVVISGCSSMAELQPSKLVVRVRFPSPALWKKHDWIWLIEFSFRCCSSVVERVLGKDEVMGSNPISSSDCSSAWHSCGVDFNLVVEVSYIEDR